MTDRIGERVGAILGAEAKVCKFLGYGVYEGDFIPPETVGGFNLGFPNPRIKLDNGDVVWGCEVWWGPEDRIKDEIEGYKTKGLEIRLVKIEDERKAGVQ